MVDIADPFKPGGGAESGTFDWIKGFGMSAVESIPELIGITPSTDTLAWRQDNPVGGFTSQLGGMAVPYMGWLKVASSVPRFAKAVQAIGDIQKAPVRTGFLRAGAELAPFEAGRLGISQIPGVGDKSFGEMLTETSMNLVLAGGVGGLIGGIAAAGKRDPKLATLFPGIDVNMPLTLQARKMREVIDSGRLVGDDLDRARSVLFSTLNSARTEVLPAGSRYVGKISHDFVPGAEIDTLESQLNRLFRVRTNDPKNTLYTRAFAHGVESNFPNAAAWKDIANKSGFAEGFEEFGQFYRHVSFNSTGKGAGKISTAIDDKLTKNMESVDANTFITREADDGMFVLARKIAGKPGTGDKADQWTIWKTDQPARFLPDADRWSKMILNEHAWIPGANAAADGGPVYNALNKFTQDMPLRNYMSLGANPSKVGEAISALLPKDLVGKGSEAFARASEAFREYLAPRIHQFKKSWRANWLTNAMKLAYDNAETMTQRLMNGEIKVELGKNLISAGLSGERVGSLGFIPVRDAVMAVPEKDFSKFWKIWHEGLTPEAIAAQRAKGHTPETDHLFDPSVMKLVQELDRVDQYVWTGLNKAEDAVNRPPTENLVGRYGLGRAWEGDTRLVIRNESDEVVGLAGGPNRRSAKANAEQLVKENPGWQVKGEYSLSQGDIPADVKPIIYAASYTLERQGLRGFLHDTKPFTRDEFLQMYENQMRSKMKYQANLATDDILGSGFDKLLREDPAAFRMVNARRDDYAGVPSKFSRWQNQVTDAVLGPIIGENSATKIVQATNTALFNLQLGALKLSFPLVNAMTFLQNVMPETAFVMGKAPPERLAQFYSHFAAGGTKGPVGGIAALSPIKMMYGSFKEMAKPGVELSEAFERAVKDRVIDPRMVENYIGESATKVQDLRKALSGGKELAEWTRALSEWLPAQSERFARTQAFTNGHIIARDFLKSPTGSALNKDQAYNFARQFTENTMYLYAASDKPRIFTTPAGSAMGLFKNWMFHFLGAMGEYTKEGFRHNNWSPLLWQTTGTFSLGGMAATPMWWAAEQFSRQWNKKSALENSYDQMGSGADGILYGLPAALTGISLYSNVNTPMSNPTRDATQLFSVVAWDRMKQMGKLGGAAFDHWQSTGQHPGQDRNTREMLLRAFAPTTIYRSFGAMSEPGQIIQMGTARPQLKDMPPMSRWLYAFGFNPVELDRATAISQELYTKHSNMKAAQTKLGNAWADAEQSGRSEQMGLIMRQAVTWGVDVGKVIEEGMREMTRRRLDVVERTMRPADIPYLRAAIEQHQEDAAERRQ